MTAGRGIMHAEMPRQNVDGSANVGLQLWVDLPEKLKACEPRYRDLRASEIPQVDVDGGKVRIKVISGQSHGVDSVRDLAYTPVWILDIEIKPGGKVEQSLPKGWNALAYVLGGETLFGAGGDQTAVAQYHSVVFEQAGESVSASVAADATENGHFSKASYLFFFLTRFKFMVLTCSAVLVAGLPLDQEVVQYGPFVLQSQEQVYEALKDYQTYSNGFERGRDWKSEIGKSMVH
jgi:hypothetical protein